MIAVKFNFDLKSIQRYVKDVQKKLDKNLVKQKIEVGKYIQRGVKKRAPVDSGDLRRELTYEVKGEDIITYVPKNSRAGKYAGFVTHGTKHQKANPFVTKFVNKNERSIMNIIAKTTKGIKGIN